MKDPDSTPDWPGIASRIVVVRTQKVILSSDLAELGDQDRGFSTPMVQAGRRLMIQVKTDRTVKLQHHREAV